jgi:hypothetical protein
LNAFTYVKQTMDLGDGVSGLFLTAVVIGIAGGSLAAGKMSKEKVELGLVPLGAVGMGVFTLDLFFAHGSLARVLVDAALLGFASGLFVIPLTTLVQARSPDKERGRVLSTLNFYSFVAILLASVFLWAAARVLKTNPAQIFLILGVLSSLTAVVIAFFIPQAPLRLFLYLLTNLVYRIRVIGRENVPAKGGGPAVAQPRVLRRPLLDRRRDLPLDPVHDVPGHVRDPLGPSLCQTHGRDPRVGQRRPETDSRLVAGSPPAVGEGPRGLYVRRGGGDPVGAKRSGFAKGLNGSWRG